MLESPRRPLLAGRRRSEALLRMQCARRRSFTKCRRHVRYADAEWAALDLDGRVLTYELHGVDAGLDGERQWTERPQTFPGNVQGGLLHAVDEDAHLIRCPRRLDL